MPRTPDTSEDVFARLREEHREWPHTEHVDTVSGNPWALAWEAAAYANAWFDHEHHESLEPAIQFLPVEPVNYGYDAADWHAKREPDALIRAQILRLVNGWTSQTDLVDYLEAHPAVATAFGFNGDIPSKATFWRAWNKRLSDTHQDVLSAIAENFVEIARDHDVPTPDVDFLHDSKTDDEDESSGREKSLKRLAADKTEEIWSKAKPYIIDNYHLNRAANASIDETTWWEAHTYMGSREEMCAHDGLDNYYAESTRGRVQHGSTHRHHIKNLSVDEMREYHRDATERLIREARQRGLFDRKVTVAIDRSKSNPYRSKHNLEGWSPGEDGGVTEKWILGYKGQNEKYPEYYFQWATIQIIDGPAPLVLDALPVHRGQSRGEIVDDLLTHATDMVNIELVMMDREFDNDAVKDVCERHDVYYLNPGVMHQSEKAECTRLRRANRDVLIKTQDTMQPDRPSRKQIFVPAENRDIFEASLDSIANPEEYLATQSTQTDSIDHLTELRNEFKETVNPDADLDLPTGEPDLETDEDITSEFEAIVAEEKALEASRPARGSKKDAQAYALFETNHPRVHPKDDDGNVFDEIEQAEIAHRFVRRYSARWVIESGFKKIKSMRVRTTSRDHKYRFFNFLYASTLFNVWRLVNVLVQIALNKNISSEPIITSDMFLTTASKRLGIPPPD